VLVRSHRLRQSNDGTQLSADVRAQSLVQTLPQGDVVSSRYPRIREVYAGHALVQALDRIDALSGSNGVIQLILVQYLDVLEAALGSGPEAQQEPGSLLRRALDAVHDVLEAFELIEPLEGSSLN
jgi:hypothetical protein